MRRVELYAVFWLSLLLTTLAFSISAQSPATLTARILDEQNQGVPFASIRLIKYNAGVITNADGTFLIPARQEFLTDTLVITCIGLKTRRVAMSSLDLSKQNNIRLQTSAIELNAIEIRASGVKRLTGTRLVERAIKRIPYNYPDKAFSYVAYYRDYQVKDNQYVNLNEALVQVIDSGFLTDDQLNTKIQLIDYRQNPAFTIDTIARQPYDNRSRKFIPKATLRNFQGNELATLMVHDPIRNHKVFSFSFVNKLDRDFLNNHRFSISGRITEGGKELYIVSFVTHDHVSGAEHQAVGKLYIEKGNYRIHKLQYSTNEWQSLKAVPIYMVNVEYALHNDLMYLNYISFNNAFKMKSPDDFEVVDVHQSKDSSGFVVRFSHEPSLSALDGRFYDFRVNGKRIEIKEIVFTELKVGKPGYHMTVLVLPKNTTDFNNALWKSSDKAMSVDIRGITDLEGREVNVPTYIDATQYREIFVQQLLSDERKRIEYPDMKKNTPLYAIPETESRAPSSEYWMNTPLKTELDNN